MLVPAYRPEVLAKILEVGPTELKGKTVVFVLCGGFKIDRALMKQYEEVLRGSNDSFTLMCGEDTIEVSKT